MTELIHMFKVSGGLTLRCTEHRQVFKLCHTSVCLPHWTFLLPLDPVTGGDFLGAATASEPKTGGSGHSGEYLVWERSFPARW